MRSEKCKAVCGVRMMLRKRVVGEVCRETFEWK